MVDSCMNMLEPPERVGLKVGNTKRISTGQIGIQSCGTKIQSRYLRASIGSCHEIQSRYLRVSSGSCHDSCKNGRKHGFEEKEKSPKPIVGITAAAHERCNLTNDIILFNGEKNQGIKIEPSDSKTNMRNNAPVVTRETSSSTMKVAVSRQQVPVPGEQVSAKCASSPKLEPVLTKPSCRSSLGDSSSKRDNEIKVKKRLLQMSSAGSPSSGRNKKIVRKGVMGTSEKGEMKKIVRPSSVSVSPRCLAKRAVIIEGRKQANCRNLRSASHLKNQNNEGETELKQLSSEEVREKTLYIIEPTAEYKPTGLARNGAYSTLSSPSSKNERLSHAKNGGLSNQFPLSPESKNPRHTKNKTQRVHVCPSLSVCPKDESLRRILTGSCSSRLSLSSVLPLSTSMSPLGSVSTKENCAFFEHVETEVKNKVTSPEVKCENTLLQKGGIISSEEKECLPQKLSFWRGKAMELQPEEGSPRKLRFRQGRVIGYNQNSKDDTRIKNFWVRGAEDGESNDMESESKKVVLRHWDMQGKKGGQSLLNNVIEETASKLVETRRSKVKALVGAFETVISLQDTNKPSAATAC